MDRRSFLAFGVDHGIPFLFPAFPVLSVLEELLSSGEGLPQFFGGGYTDGDAVDIPRHVLQSLPWPQRTSRQDLFAYDYLVSLLDRL